MCILILNYKSVNGLLGPPFVHYYIIRHMSALKADDTAFDYWEGF